MSTLATTVPRSAARIARRRRITPLDILSGIWMVFLVGFAVIPMLWMLSTSLKGQFAALQQPPEWIPSHPTLQHYITLLSPTGDVGPVFLRYFLNSMIVSLSTTALGVLVAVPAAYAFSR